MANGLDFSNRQLQAFGLIFLVVVTLLAAVYFFVFRTEMVPAYENIRESDTSAIAVQLEESGVPFELRNDGHDVYVPEDRLPEARVAVAGSQAAIGSTVGFELFNESDMGLTEFAQKINYQRAMQGELARTIMAMEGVDFARVHLALPERSLFRSGKGVPTAAVTVQMKRGFALTRQRVGGIRQLVASSVPELAFGSVAVLDEKGGLVSGSPSGAEQRGQLTARSALEQFYRVRAQEVAAAALPGVPVEIEFSARPKADTLGMDSRAAPGRNDYYFTLLVRTPYEIATDDRENVEIALSDALELRRENGDVLNFTVGAVGFAKGAPAGADTFVSSNANDSNPEAAFDRSALDEPSGWGSLLPERWILFLFAALVLIAFVMRPRRRLDDAQTVNFAAALKRSSENDHAG